MLCCIYTFRLILLIYLQLFQYLTDIISSENFTLECKTLCKDEYAFCTYEASLYRIDFQSCGFVSLRVHLGTYLPMVFLLLVIVNI